MVGLLILSWLNSMSGCIYAKLVDAEETDSSIHLHLDLECFLFE
jgi:hypothetical protein